MAIEAASPVRIHTRTVQTRIRNGGYSEFFRIRGQAALWSILSSHLALPNGGNPRTVISVGCSTGEEPYSVAILAHFMGLDPQPRIIGIDSNAERLAKARTGTYQKHHYVVPPDQAIPSQYFRYFSGLNDHSSPDFSVLRAVREKVVFVHGNAAIPDSLPAGVQQADIVLSMNLIPESQDLIPEIRAGALALLRPGGIMIVTFEDGIRVLAPLPDRPAPPSSH